jgi:hypothetical protein
VLLVAAARCSQSEPQADISGQRWEWELRWGHRWGLRWGHRCPVGAAMGRSLELPMLKEEGAA